MSTVTAVTFFFAAVVIGAVAVLIREYEMMWLIAGYDPEQVTDDERLANFMSVWLLIIAGLNAIVGVLELALSNASMTIVYGIAVVAMVAVAGYMIYGAQRYTAS
jgi:hypothetical protein